MSLIYSVLQEMDGLAGLLKQENRKTIDLGLVYIVSIRGTADDLKPLLALQRSKVYSLMGDSNIVDILDLKEAGLYQIPDYVVNFEKEYAEKVQRWAANRTETNLNDLMRYSETHIGNDEKGWRRKVWGGANDPVLLQVDRVEDGTNDMYIGLLVEEFPIHWFTNFLGKLNPTEQIELTWIGENKWRADYGMIRQFPGGTTTITMNDIDQYSSILIRTLPFVNHSDEIIDREEKLDRSDIHSLRDWITSSVDNVRTRGYLSVVGKGSPTVFALVKELSEMPFETMGDQLTILTQLRMIEDSLTHEKEYTKFYDAANELAMKMLGKSLELREIGMNQLRGKMRDDITAAASQYNFTEQEIDLALEMVADGQSVAVSVLSVLDARNKSKSAMDKIITESHLEDIAKQAGQQVANSPEIRKKFEGIAAKMDKDIQAYEQKSDVYIRTAMEEAVSSTPLTDEEMLSTLEFLYASKDAAVSLYTSLKNFSREDEVWKSFYYPLLDDLLDPGNDGKYDASEIGRIYQWIEQQLRGD